MFHVYIIRNTSGKFYIGQTNNLKERIKMHNENRVKSTRNKGPWEYVITKEFLSRGEAMKTESYLKSMKNSQKAIVYLKNVG